MWRSLDTAEKQEQQRKAIAWWQRHREQEIAYLQSEIVRLRKRLKAARQLARKRIARIKELEAR